MGNYEKRVSLFVTKMVYIFGAKMWFLAEMKLCVLFISLTKCEQGTTVTGVYTVYSFAVIHKRKTFSSCVLSIANIPEFFKRDRTTGIRQIEGFLELPL